MNVPPPFVPPSSPPQRKSNTPLIIGIVLACVLIPCIGLIVVGAMGFNFFKNTIGPMATCAIGFEQVRDSILDYSEEHDGALPKAATWQDDVRPFYAERIKNHRDEYGPFEPMKADGDWGCKAGEKMTGIAFNAELGGKKVEDVKDPYTTVLIFEIESAMKNANQPYKPRPKDTSPMLMGEHRGWMTMSLRGKTQGIDMDRGAKFEIKTGTDSKDASNPKEGF